MTWVELDDGFADAPKLVRAIGKVGDSAGWVWVRGCAYCNRHLTDGFVPTEVVPSFTKHRKPFDVAAALVEAGAWELAEGGFVVHDFLDWNDSREQVTAKRAALSAKRAAAGLAGGKQSGAARRANAEAKSKQVASTDTKQSGSKPSCAVEALSSPLLSPPSEVTHTAREPQSEDPVAAELLIELRTHPALGPVATVVLAEQLAGIAFTKAKRTEDMRAAIADAARDVAAEEGTSGPLLPRLIAQKVARYCDNARRPKPNGHAAPERQDAPARTYRTPAELEAAAASKPDAGPRRRATP